MKLHLSFTQLASTKSRIFCSAVVQARMKCEFSISRREISLRWSAICQRVSFAAPSPIPLTSLHLDQLTLVCASLISMSSLATRLCRNLAVPAKSAANAEHSETLKSFIGHGHHYFTTSLISVRSKQLTSDWLASILFELQIIRDTKLS